MWFWLLRVRVPSATRLRPAVAGLRRGRPSFASGGLARPVLKIQRMSNPIDLFGQSELRVATPAFWKRILNDEELRECDDLEKLLAGCEIIAGLDGRDLLAA